MTQSNKELTVDELLLDHQGDHSQRQIDSFIVGDSGGSAYGAYKQCLRELDARHATLTGMADDIETQRMELRQRERGLASTLKSQAEVQREQDRFLVHARALKAQIGELTPQKRVALDDGMWVQRLRFMLALDVFTMGGPSHGTAETIFKCPPGMRAAILAGLGDRESAANWLQSAEAPRLPGG